MIYSLEDKVLGFTEKDGKLSLLVKREKQCSKRSCILIHGVKENQKEDADEIVANKIKSQVNLEIYSRRDNDCTNRTDVSSKGENGSIVIKFVRYMDWSREFTNKKLKRGKDISITERLN